jgi:hypothetical protein
MGCEGGHGQEAKLNCLVFLPFPYILFVKGDSYPELSASLRLRDFLCRMRTEGPFERVVFPLFSLKLHASWG